MPKKFPSWAASGQHMVSPCTALETDRGCRLKCQSAGRSPYRSKRVCCLLRIDGLDSKTCGRFRFLPVATAAAAAIPTGPGNQTTKGESAHATQELAKKNIAIDPLAGRGAMGSAQGPPHWTGVTQIPHWAPQQPGSLLSHVRVVSQEAPFPRLANPSSIPGESHIYQSTVFPTIT